MTGEVAVTDSATPASLRWVIPATVVGALLGMQRDRHAQIYIDAAEGPTGASAFSVWLNHAQPLMTSLRNAFDDVAEAASASDFVGTGAACRAGLGLTNALVAELPS